MEGMLAWGRRRSGRGRGKYLPCLHRLISWGYCKCLGGPPAAICFPHSNSVCEFSHLSAATLLLGRLNWGMSTLGCVIVPSSHA